MSIDHPSYSIGIEEEYLLIDRETLDLAPAPDALMEACAKELDDQVSPEFLQCQIEVGTRVCRTVAEARADLANLRRTIARLAGEFGLAPLAVSCHPVADWARQHHTDKQRYNELERDLAAVARRLLICGMHVHVGVEDDDMRIDLMAQLSYFLPHILALSTSSPFWQGQDTGLNCYRLTVFDNLPRTGLPPVFESFAEYTRSVDVIRHAGVIEDATKIWWDIRPSARYPTLETRVCDVMPRLDHTASVAALLQCITRMLVRLKRTNQRWRIYDCFLIGENRWRAQRHGPREGLMDFGRGAVVPFDTLLEELLDLIAEDAEALECIAEASRARDILAQGTSADRQRDIHARARADGASESEAMDAVLRHLIDEYLEGV